MLTKDLLRVSRAGGGYQPQFAAQSDRTLAECVIDVFDDHIGKPRQQLDAALEDLEHEADDYKLVRGFAALLDRKATFETDAPVDPTTARREAFESAEAIGVVSADERVMALVRAGESLGVSADDVASALFADREDRQLLVSVDADYDADGLWAQYNLSLSQTALFDATAVRIRSSDPKTLVSTVKRLRLLYEIERTDDGRVVVVTGPTRLHRATRRYGTRFARLLRTISTATEWHLEATIDDRGTERTMTLSQEDPIRPPDADPVATVTYDSNVEADFAGRFSHLDLEWDLVREPEPLETGTRVMIPDFAFDYAHDDYRVYLEIMGFWTPEYVSKKLDQLANLETVEMLVAVDESLGVNEDIERLDHRAIPYTGTVRVKDVVEELRTFERELVAASREHLPVTLVPDEDVMSLSTLANRYGVSVDAVAGKRFPEHELVGRVLVRPTILDSLDDEIEPGMTLGDVESVLETFDLSDTSAVLSELGYRIAWEGLNSGRVEERD